MKNLLIAIFCLAMLSCQNMSGNNGEASNNDSSIVMESNNYQLIRQKAIEKTLFKDSIPYEIIRFYETTKKSTNARDSASYAYVKATYPQFEGDHSFLNNKILSIVSAEPWTGNKTYSMKKASEAFFKEYLEFKKDYPESNLGYTWDENLEVSFQDVNLMVLTDESYVYTGGAHGLESIIYYNIDLKNQKELTLEDMLTADYSNHLTDVAESIFREDEGLNQTETLEGYFFENKIFELNDNFAITNKGLLFTYNPYEIKAYSEGTTDLLVPYSKIKDLIKPNSLISKYINK